MSDMMKKAVAEVLSMWEELDEWHRGKDYEKAVENIKRTLDN